MFPVMSTYGRFPLSLVKGKGSYVWDEEGNKYLDYTSGIATCNLGHVPDVVKEQLVEQLQQLWHCSNLYHIPKQQLLAQVLIENSCADEVFFCNSGAEANEAAIKIARKYAQTVKKNDSFEIISFTQSFHGRTMATLSATGQEKIQKGFYPLLEGFYHLPYNDLQSLDELATIKPCAVILELVQGEGGVVPADPQWVHKLSDLCQKHDILLMVDEIQTGMGRTGTLFAYEQYGIEPDVLTLAKGLGSGFPIGAMLAKSHVAKAFDPGSHGSTFGGNPLAVTAGLSTLEYMIQENIPKQALKSGEYLLENLKVLASHSDDIKEIRGKGLFLGIVVKTDALSFVQKARENKLLVLPAGPNVVRILPPLTTNKKEMDQFLSVMKDIFM
ncbi:acetylornithine transaminase [Bacillaceae bacterium S4-13-56]